MRLFTDVRPGEGQRLLLMTLNVFLILAAYYVMKPVREALILAQPGGAEIKSYAMAGQALLLTLAVPLYGALATRMPRRWLINLVTIFFIACLPVFYVLTQNGVSIGLAFFLWIGIFSLMVIAQFWAFANDLYTPEAGKRLFALIAFGASSGAVFGAFICARLIRMIGVPPLLLVAAAVLAASLALFNLVDGRPRRRSEETAAPLDADRPIGAGNPFGIVLGQRYLLLIALLILLLNWVNATGRTPRLRGRVDRRRRDRRRSPPARPARHVHRPFFAGYFQVVNVAGMLLQRLLVSRVITRLGVPVAVCVLPVVAMVSYGMAALIPSLGILRWVKTAENSIDYSPEHGRPRPLSAHHPRGQVQGQAGHRHLLRAGRRSPVGRHHPGGHQPAGLRGGSIRPDECHPRLRLARSRGGGRPRVARRVPAPRGPAPLTAGRRPGS